MTQLRGETLELVLGYLTAAGDFVRCSAVNRAWAQASNLTQIRVLALQHNMEGVPRALSKIRWLQGLQQRGCLKNWQEARLQCIAHSEQLDPLAQGIIMLAGSYRLTKCDLSGSFCLVTALGLLPTSLLSLGLWPETGPAIIHMSAFKRFTTLKGLRLGVEACSEPAEFNGVVSDECMFVIDAPFPCLRSLLLVMTCHLASGCGITECLPQLNVFSSWLYNDAHGVQLAESLILLGCLQKLQLTFNRYTADAVDFTLCVHEASSIKELTIQGPRTQDASVVIGKDGIRLNLHDVHVATVVQPQNVFSGTEDDL